METELIFLRAVIFFLIHRSHSISFTRAQGIPKYKIGFGREKDGRVLGMKEVNVLMYARLRASGSARPW
jgi:hypothetical protein